MQGIIHRNLPEQLNTFRDFYSNLYSSQRGTPLTLADYLEDTALAWLGDTQRKFLSLDLELDKITDAIMQMKSRQAPGSDGLPIEFYKTFAPILAPILKEVFYAALEEGCLPRTMREALTTYLLTPGKS